MGRSTAWLFLGALALLAGGCAETPYGVETVQSGASYGPTSYEKSLIESRYRDHLYEMQKGMRVQGDPEGDRFEMLARTLEDYADDTEYALRAVIVGLPPNERKVGYIEQVVYPRVILYNRDSGKYEKTRFEFNYVKDLDLGPAPQGVVLGNGRTILAGREPGEDILLGRYALETAALILLHICPVCGAPVPENVFFSLTRPDIDPEGVRDFKTAMVKKHSRLNSDYLPVQGLPREFWKHPRGHTCFQAFKGAKDYGFEPMIPVRLPMVKSEELTAFKKKPGE